MFKKAITLYVLVLLILRFGVSFDETDFISKYQASLETNSASTTQEIEHLVHSLYELDKENVSLVYITGVFQYLSSRINDSIQSFRILCDLDEYKTPRYVIQYATVLNTSDPDGAIEVLESGMQSNPKNIALRAALVDAYLYTNRLHDAFRSLIILIGLQPEDYRLWTRFTSFFLSNHGIFHSTLLNKGSAAVEFDIVYIRKLFIIGLQLYPRCAGLLFAEALTYALAAHFENNPQHFSCAFDLLQRSIKYGIEHWVYIDSDGSDKSYRSLAEYNLEMIRNAVKRESLEHVVDLTAAVDCIDPISKHQYIFSPDSKIDTVPEIVNNSHGQWLQIGCSSTELCAKIGWTSVDALEGLSVHIVAPAYGLEMLPDASFERLYSSHTLEHLSHSQETAIRNGHDCLNNYFKMILSQINKRHRTFFVFTL